jgi:phage terminase small subunit
MSRKLSDEEKKRRGTYRKDRVKPVATFPEMENIPDPPDHLSTRGAQLYYEAASWLNEKGLLNIVVARQVGAYAFEMDKYYQCIEQLEQEGESKAVYDKEGERFLYFQANPLCKIANAHLRIALSWAKQLLISPFDADKIPSRPAPPEDNPFARL